VFHTSGSMLSAASEGLHSLSVWNALSKCSKLSPGPFLKRIQAQSLLLYGKYECSVYALTLQAYRSAQESQMISCRSSMDGIPCLTAFPPSLAALKNLMMYQCPVFYLRYTFEEPRWLAADTLHRGLSALKIARERTIPSRCCSPNPRTTQ
jgi:hypothetical protein